jgi:D-alanyl-D-alanine carboxypeptidase
MSDLGNIRKTGYTIPISRQMAIDAGIIEPTAEERAEEERAHAEYLAEVEAAKPQYEAALQTIQLLTASDDTHSLAARLLHQHENKGGVCKACWVSEETWPTWPCNVVQTIALHYGTPFPDTWL